MTLAGSMVSSCLQLLWPAHCAGCDVLLHSDAAVFCGTCTQSINPLGLTCAACGLPVQPAPTGDRPCAGCAQRHFAFSRACAGFEYGAALAAAIVKMKHGGRPDLARRLGRILQDAILRSLRAEGGPPIDAVVPVPLHPRKLRSRGFNQSVELARTALGLIRRRAGPLGTQPSLPWPPPFERDLLLRVRNTRELGRWGPVARRIEVFGAFAVADERRIAGRRFLVVDDVMTTGATLNECAETLLRAGAAEVRVAALARAVG